MIRRRLSRRRNLPAVEAAAEQYYEQQQQQQQAGASVPRKAVEVLLVTQPGVLLDRTLLTRGTNDVCCAHLYIAGTRNQTCSIQLLCTSAVITQSQCVLIEHAHHPAHQSMSSGMRAVACSGLTAVEIHQDT
jgi:hypothetical protein